MGKATRGRTPKRSRKVAGIAPQPLAPLQEAPTGRELVPPRKPTPLLGGPIELVCRAIKGNKETFIELARLAVQIEPGISRFVDAWDGLDPVGQKHADLDNICLAKELDPGHVMAVVGEAAAKFRDNASIIIAALSMPGVVEKSVKVALTTDGYRDRKMLFEHARFLPVAQHRINIGIVNKNNATAEAAAESATAGAGRGLPSHEQTVGDADDALQESGL